MTLEHSKLVIIEKLVDISGSSNNIEYITVKCLELLIKEMEYDRTYLYIENYDSDSTDYFFESVSNEIYSRINSNLTDELKRCFEIVRKNSEKVTCSRKDSDPALVNQFLKNDQQSILTKPIVWNSKIVGFIGIDQCSAHRSFSALDEIIIDAFSLICSNIMLRLNQETIMRHKNQNLMTLMDNLGGISYAVDIETDRIIFANNQLKKLFDHPLEGQICYEVFQQKNKRCDFCTTSQLLESDNVPCYEFFNSQLNRTFLLSDRLIELQDGTKTRFEIGIDISENKRLENQVKEEKEHLKALVHSMPSGVLAIDTNLTITLINKEMQRLVGVFEEAAIGANLFDILKTDIDENKLFFSTDSSNVEFDSRADSFFCNISSVDGSEHPCKLTISKISINRVHILGYVLILSDQTESIESRNKIDNLLKVDSITKALTRPYFENKIINDKWDDHNSISVIIGDINGLKLVNDVLSHKKGDDLLELFASVIKKNIPSSAYMVRWGGDEILILISDIENKETEEIINRIKSDCSEVHFDLPLSVSFGYEVLKNEFTSQIFDGIHKAENYLNRHKLLESRSDRSFIIESMRKSLFERSHETEEHAGRLSAVCHLMGKKMALSMGAMDEIELLAKLHDIGKISIKDSILLKPGLLSDMEWIEMKKHPEAGYRILQGFPGLSKIAYYVLCHHERWDGTGYPQELKRDEIPLHARILAIADSFDAITQDRPYHKGESCNAARAEIKRCSGSQFDPTVVDIFDSVFPDIEKALLN